MYYIFLLGFTAFVLSLWWGQPTEPPPPQNPPPPQRQPIRHQSRADILPNASKATSPGTLSKKQKQKRKKRNRLAKQSRRQQRKNRN